MTESDRQHQQPELDTRTRIWLRTAAAVGGLLFTASLSMVVAANVDFTPIGKAVVEYFSEPTPGPRPPIKVSSSPDTNVYSPTPLAIEAALKPQLKATPSPAVILAEAQATAHVKATRATAALSQSLPTATPTRYIPVMRPVTLIPGI